MSASNQKRRFRGGAYATAISFLVIVVLVIVNLISGSVFKEIDLTSTGKYSLAADTKAFVKTVDTPINIYYVTSEGEEDLTIQTGAEQIAAANDLIDLTYKDPLQYPQFVYRYNGMAEITNNSIIVENADNPDRYVYIDSEQMKIYNINFAGSSITRQIVGYDAELEIVKAIVTVTQECRGKVYITTNHAEILTNPGDPDEAVKGKLTPTFEDLLALNAYQTHYFNLATTGAVPGDCDILLIGGLSSDLLEEEVAAIEDYMTAGGTVILVLRVQNESFVNQQALLSYYGLRVGNGIVCEGDSGLTLSNVAADIITTDGDERIRWPLCAPLYTDGTIRATTSIDTYAKTTDRAYLKALNVTSYQKASGDETGTYPLLLKVTDNFHGKTGTMYVMSTELFFMDVNITGSSSLANRTFFINCLNEQAAEDSVALSIPDTTALEEALRMTTKQKNNVAILSFLIPVLILIAGIVVFLLRRIEKVDAKQ